MTAKEAIEQERDERMKPWRERGMTPEPAISIPLNRVFVSDGSNTATITLADLAQCFD